MKNIYDIIFQFYLKNVELPAYTFLLKAFQNNQPYKVWSVRPQLMSLQY